MMQTARPYEPPLAQKHAAVDPTRTSVGHLLAGAFSMPCSTAAHAFTQIVQPISRFQLALDVLMPMLDADVEPAQRILVSFILYSLYAPHPISMNPFRSVLYATFVRERERAVEYVKEGNEVHKNEQLVWVLWKILKGDGGDIGPFSPNTLATSPLPQKLRPASLSLEEELAHTQKYNFAKGVAGATVERDEETRSFSHAVNLLLAARDRVLTLSEQKVVMPMLPKLTNPSVVTSLDIPPIVAHNPTLATALVVALLSTAPASSEHDIATYLYALRYLPPTLPSFDVIGHLLRDATPMVDTATGGRTNVADVVRADVLGWFIHESIAWLDRAEQDEREGTISDDRFPKGVSHLCRFYTSLIKLGIVDPTSDADSAEMAHFTLRNARLEDANALYRVFALGKF